MLKPYDAQPVVSTGNQRTGKVREAKMNARVGRGIRCALWASHADPRAFETVYCDMAPAVIRYFEPRTADGHVACDLTAETFAKAFEHRREFRGRSDEEATGWIWAIARSELRMFYRRRAAEARAIGRLGQERPLADDAELSRIEDLAVLSPAEERLSALFVELSEDQRTAIALRVLDELDYCDIAIRMNVGCDVVRARVSRGLRHLADQLPLDVSQAASTRPNSDTDARGLDRRRHNNLRSCI